MVVVVETALGLFMAGLVFASDTAARLGTPEVGSWDTVGQEEALLVQELPSEEARLPSEEARLPSEEAKPANEAEELQPLAAEASETARGTIEDDQNKVDSYWMWTPFGAFAALAL